MIRCDRSKLLAALLSLLLIPLWGCSDDDSPTDPQTGTVEVSLLAQSFSPDHLVVEAGTTVRWVNQGNEFHTITPDGHTEWAEATVQSAGETFEHTFGTPGTFDYYCQPHRGVGMEATIEVVAP